MNDNQSRYSKSTKLVTRDISESLGKLPPQAIDLEESILGAAMLEKNGLLAVLDVLKEDDFYLEAHKEIWGAILSLSNNSEPVDMRTVVDRLRSTAKLELVGGAYYIAQLTSRVSSAANIEYHARIVCEFSMKREMIRLASQLHQDCYEDTTDVFQVIEEFQNKIDQVSNSKLRGAVVDMHTLYRNQLKEITSNQNDKGVTGLPTGYREIDSITGGLQKQNLIIVAARPGQGKSVLASEIAKNIGKGLKKPGAIFSLEMAKREIVNRMIASESQVSLTAIIRGSLTGEELSKIANNSATLDNIPVYVDDTPALTIVELKAKCRRLVHEKKIEWIIIDYLQLMVGDKTGSREQEIASISRALKALAKELDLPVIALSTLSREVEKRADKRPQLSDLRDSGQIEADADVVIFLLRPEYYRITVDMDGESTQGLMEAIIAKNRNGVVKSAKLRFIGEFTKITDWTDNKAPF